MKSYIVGSIKYNVRHVPRPFFYNLGYTGVLENGIWISPDNKYLVVDNKQFFAIVSIEQV